MSIINDYMKYTAKDGRSKRFHLFSILAAISASMERRLWLRTSLGDLSPNIYVLLVGPPGSGKTSCIKRVESLVKRIDYNYQQPRIKFSPVKITPAALIEVFGSSLREYDIEGTLYPQCPVFASIYELSDFFTDIGGGSLMKELLTYYDPPGFLTAKEFEVVKKTRTFKDETIVNPSLVVLAGTTTDYLSESLATSEGRQGLSSRIIFCVDNDFYEDSSDIVEYDKKLEAEIIFQLGRVTRMKGPMTFGPSADEAWKRIVKENNELRKAYHKSSTMYEQYYNRRLTQIQKLAMINSVSRSVHRVIEAEDIESAVQYLAGIEPEMPLAFGMRAIHKDPNLQEIILSFVPEYPKKILLTDILAELRKNGYSLNIDSQAKAALDYIAICGEVVTTALGNGNILYQRVNKKGDLE